MIGVAWCLRRSRVVHSRSAFTGWRAIVILAINRLRCHHFNRPRRMLLPASHASIIASLFLVGKGLMLLETDPTSYLFSCMACSSVLDFAPRIVMLGGPWKIASSPRSSHCMNGDADVRPHFNRRR